MSCRRTLGIGADGRPRLATALLVFATVPLGLAVSATAQLAVLVVLLAGSLALERAAAGHGRTAYDRPPCETP